MATISTAVGTERISRVSGYKIKKGFFSNETTNLPQLIAVFGEANTANQVGLTTDKVEITSAQEAAELFGYGSPIHQQMRILRPISSDGVGGIPTVVFPQISDGAATPTIKEWTVTGTATANATHRVVINGRRELDFQSYAFSVVAGDSDSDVAAKINDVINGVLSAPCTATVNLNAVTLETKWAGGTSAEFNVSIDFGSDSAGLSYTETNGSLGSGVVDLADSLSQFGDDWYTIVTNPYGDAQFTSLEAFNGIPDPDNPTGRYNGLTFKPFMAYFGSTLDDKDALAAITDNPSRVEQVTNVLCAAPKSKGFSWEALSNVVVL